MKPDRMLRSHPLPFLSAVLITLIAFSGCKKEDDGPVTPVPTTAPAYPISSNAVFSVSVDGEPTLHVTGGAVENQGGYWTFANPTTVQSTFYNSDLFETVAGIDMAGLAYAGAAPTAAEFNAFFTTGAKPFWSPANQTGVTVNFHQYGNPYSSSGGTQPGGSSFNVTDVQLLPDDGTGIARVKVRATFTCKVFGMSGTTLQLNNGICVGVFTLEE